ncbi:lipocalin-like domain-containing protein [Chitinophaga sp.]|uniref:lipocalin-like domain-containing protein n=1 Tax=Chitinophaga sp. TaxID=1869181 RepID=UPI0031DE9ECC
MKTVITLILILGSVYSSIAQTMFPLAGTWLLKEAQVILPDGTRTTDSTYGKNAKGVLMIDASGQYSLQIFRPDRPKFVSGDKKRGTPAEYKAALGGISTHIGHITMDTMNKTLQFKIDYAAYPNWDNTSQIRNFKLQEDELYYEVPAKTAAGTIAVSIWKRIRTK